MQTTVDDYSGLAGRTVEKLREYSVRSTTAVRPIDRYLIDIAAVRWYRITTLPSFFAVSTGIRAVFRAGTRELVPPVAETPRPDQRRSDRARADKENSFPREQVLLQLLAACYGNTP